MNDLKHLNKLEKDIKIIVDQILEITTKSIESIILYGSYGRGEGAFFYDEQGVIRTYNDYDIIIVVKKTIEHQKLSHIQNLLEEKLDIKWIDISQKTIDNLKTLPLTIFNYDLKYGSKVIFGDQDVLNFIPNFESKNISLKEAETLYFTRIWTFLGSLPADGFTRILNKEESRFFRNQMAKAILAVVDIVLLQKGAYHSSYRKRVELISEDKTNEEDFIELANWAITEKCNPKADILEIQDLKSMYHKVACLFNTEMNKVLSIYYGRKITSSADIKRSILASKSEWIIFIKYALKNWSLGYFKKVKIKIAQSYIFEAYFKEGNHKLEYLKKTKKMIGERNRGEKDLDQEWNRLRLLVAKIRNEV